MRVLLTVVMACLLGSTIAAAAAQEAPADGAARTLVPRAITFPGVQAFTWYSDIMQREYTVTIRFPRQYREQTGQKFPALIITDGNQFFAAASHALSAVEPELQQPMVLVAIGSPPEDGFLAHQQRRVHEFSPPGWNLDDAFGKSVANSCAGWKLELAECTGGAPAFLSFITGELLPELQASFRIDPDQLSLGGVSAGGFFAAWAMFQQDAPFRNYLISSPAMAYGDGVIFTLEAAYAAVNKDLAAGVYLASGGRELDDPFIEGVGKVVSGQAQFGALLRNRGYPGLRLRSESHAGLGHIDVVPVSYAQGLRFLFGADTRPAGEQP